jgi:hypothetical protein
MPLAAYPDLSWLIRGEPFWGGGFIRRDGRVGGSQDEGD